MAKVISKRKLKSCWNLYLLILPGLLLLKHLGLAQPLLVQPRPGFVGVEALAVAEVPEA